MATTGTTVHSVVTSESVEAVWFSGCLALIKASRESTGGTLAMVEFTHSADFAVPPHVHHDADEAFYILEGAARGFCGEDQWHATAGDFVWLPRGVPHAYAADRDAGTLRTLAITCPTGFEQFVREAGGPRLNECCRRLRSWTFRNSLRYRRSTGRSSWTHHLRRARKRELSLAYDEVEVPKRVVRDYRSMAPEELTAAAREAHRREETARYAKGRRS